MTLQPDSMRKLPPGWRWAHVGEICDLVNGDAFKESDWSLAGTPIIRIQNLNDPSKSFNHWAGPLDDRVIVKPGDALLAWSGTPGTSFGAHLWKAQVGVLNQHIFRLDLQQAQIIPEWAVLALNHQLDILIHKAHGGVGLRHVTRKEVESLEIPLPPLEQQRRIAAILKEQTVVVERARAAAQAQSEAAKALPAAYLRAVFNSPGAQHWPRQALGEMSELLPSKSIATDGDTSVLAVTTACLTEAGFDPSGVKSARMWANAAAECVLSPSEILIARSNTPDLVGRVAMYAGHPHGVVASDLTIRVRAKNSLEPQFLTAYLSFLYLSGYWRERAGGASGSMKKITRAQIEREQVPGPPIAEQRQILASLEKQMEAAKRARKTLEEQLSEIDALPAALLRRAFSGEL